MKTRKPLLFTLVAFVFGAGFILGSSAQGADVLHAQSANRVFELRIYTAPEGKLDNFRARFFERHGMTNIGYWTPQDAPNSSNTLVYIIAHDSREAAAESWQAFGSDPDWQQVRRESQADGRLVSNVESVFLDPTDFLPIQ